MSVKALVAEFDEKKIDAIFEEIDRTRLPGVAVGIAIAGVPVYRKGFGLANMELPILLSPTIRMRIASATKQFTCLLFMLLCEDGLAAADDPIGTYLPEIHPVAHKVTIRQLMGHVGGLRDAKDLVLQFDGTGLRVSSGDLISLYREISDINFAPGTSWSYNNGGYQMLTVAIERITGKSFEHALRERIFEPLGMNDTMVRRWDTDFVSNSATLHMADSNGGYEKSYLGVASAGEGGIVSTVDDMLSWLAHMDAPEIGNSATWQTIVTPQTLLNGSSTGYGLGLMSGNYRGMRTLFHPGGVMGGNAQVLKVPSAALDVVVIANRHDISSANLANSILDACLPDLEPVKVPGGCQFVTGNFHSPATKRVAQLFESGGQQIASIDGLDIPVERHDHEVLSPSAMSGFGGQRVKVIGDWANPNAIELDEWGNRDSLQKVQPTDESRADEFAGCYRSDATQAQASICNTSGGAQLRTSFRYGFAEFHMERLSRDIWRARSTNTTTPLGGILVFDPDRTTFCYSTGRTRVLKFQRSI